VTFTLEAEGTADEAEWYQIDLETGDYSFLVEAAQADNVETNLQYTLTALDQFGQEDRGEQVIWVNAIDTSFADSGTLVVTEPKTYFVRVLNGNNELDMKLTVSEE
jgi:hypothetical protein